MKLKVFSFCIWLFCSIFLGATVSPLPFNGPIPIAHYTDPCELPPPNDFHVEEQGVTWIKYAWTVADLQKHRIRTYRASDDFLLNTTIANAGVSNVTVSIPANTECYAIINTICDDGSNSTVEKHIGPIYGLISDLIVDGYTHNYNTSYCTMPNIDGFCSFPVNMLTPFWIKPTNGGAGTECRFRVEYTPQHGFAFKIQLANGNGIIPYNFYCDSGASPTPNCPTSFITIKRLAGGTESTIAVLDFGGNAMTSYLHYTMIDPNYQVQRLYAMEPPPGGGVGGDGRSDLTPNAPQRATTSPNPFTESLEVLLAHSATERVNLQLFNLSGQKVLDQQFAGGQAQYSLSTADLANGFYLLRIEADGEVQTLKVVKSE